MNCIRTVVIWSMVITWSLPAAGGGVCAPETTEELQALSLLKTWRTNPHPLKPAMAALCHDEFAIQEAATTRLKEIGPSAVKALFQRAAARKPCPWTLVDEPGPQQHTLVEVICALPQESIEGPFCSGSHRVHRDETRNTKALTWLVQRLSQGKPAQRWLALNILGQVADHRSGEGCYGREALLDLARPKLLGMLSEKDPRKRAQAIAILGRSKTGPEALVAVLGEHFKSADGTERLAVIKALGELGPVSRPALPETESWLLKLLSESCRQGERETLAQVALALSSIGGERATHLLTTLLAMSQESCPDFPMRAILSAVETHRKMGPKGIATLRKHLVQSKLPLALRIQIGRTLTAVGAGLDEGQSRLVGALKLKEQLLYGRAEPQLLPPPEVRFRQDVRHAWNVCRQESKLAPNGQIPPDQEFADPAAHATLETLTTCLNSHLCGPESKDRAAAVGSCCKKAWPTAQPDWCR